METTKEIIVYRSRMDQRMDHFINENGSAILSILGLLIGVVVLILAAYALLAKR